MITIKLRKNWQLDIIVYNDKNQINKINNFLIKIRIKEIIIVEKIKGNIFKIIAGLIKIPD